MILFSLLMIEALIVMFLEQMILFKTIHDIYFINIILEYILKQYLRISKKSQTRVIKIYRKIID